MRFLPVFLDLQAGPVLLIGAGELARAKLRLLAAAGAHIRWYTTDGNHDVSGLEPADAARIELMTGDPLAADLSGIIAILCAGAGEIGAAMSVRAKSVGLPVNVMDDLAHSTFIFPAIVDRGDVVVAVGTGGASPVVSRRVRERIEAVLPERIGDLAAFIGSFRKSMHARIPEFPLRRRFWERVIDGPIGALVLAGRKDEAEKALNEIADPSAFAGASKDGKAEGGVTLVGAGPGDPDLLTIKALRALGVAYSVVPGITAGLGAAAQFEAPLTYRHEALRITFLTAHKAKDAETVDWSVLTDRKMTIVVYMGMTAAPSVRTGLLAAGRSPKTPVGIFARVTRPDAQAVVGTLENLPALVEKIDGGPAILIIGDVVAHSAPWR